MENVESVAFSIMLPAGASMLPEGCCGAANVISDWIFRGAGTRNNRQLNDALDGLGLHRATSVGTAFMSLGATLEAGNLAPALDLYGDIVTKPHLDAGQFEPARQLAVDEVLSLDDDPRQKVMVLLREQFYPAPWGRSTLGHLEELQGLDAEATRRIVHQAISTSNPIIAVAGKYDFSMVQERVASLFAAPAACSAVSAPVPSKRQRYMHIAGDSAQVHVGLMTKTVSPADEDFYNARIAVSILSGGMSSRLFTEVREKRGLCYAIGARYHGLKEYAGIMCYAGTTPDKAQQTVEVVIDQFRELGQNITSEELQRAKVGLKSALIMQSESSSSRVGAIGSDYYILGRVRSLNEIKQRIDGVTSRSVGDFLSRHPFRDFTAVTLGPEAINIPA